MIKLTQAVLCLATLLPAQDWPRFRGPNSDGVSAATGLPSEFGQKKNLEWRVEVPPGRSSPILVKDRAYLTALDGDKLVTLALDARTGQVIWRRDLARDHTHKTYVGNDTATPTPASDGENLFVFFPDLGLVSFDAAGKERWRAKLPPFDSFYGVSSSPVVHGDTVYLVCDQRRGSYMLAADKNTGKVRWRVERPNAKTEGYATPAIYTPAKGKPKLIVSGAYRVDAYDLETGESTWFAGKQGVYPAGSPVLHRDLVVAVGEGSEQSPFPSWQSTLQRLDANKDGRLSHEEFDKDAYMKDHFGYLDADNDGYVTQAEYQQKVDEYVTEHGVTGNRIGGETLWRYKKTFSYLITPLIYRDVLYLVKDGGIITSMNPNTGEVHKAGRSPEAIDEYFSSPVAADGKVFIVSHGGKVTVLKAGAQWEVLAVNDLGETTQSTPAISNGRIVIRTNKALYSFRAAAR